MNVAILANKLTQYHIKLLPTHIFGRQADICNTLLAYQDISRLHATISWDGERWQLRDTSTNGTFVNGKAIAANTFYPLVRGDCIQFGSLQAEAWELVDSAHPVCVLISLQPESQSFEVNQLIALPSDQNPQVVIMESLDGQWICESEAGCAVLKSGDLVGVGGNIWRFIEAKPAAQTYFNERSSASIHNAIELHFFASQNEEHIRLKVAIGSQVYDLGERIHHYLLLTLARRRLHDANHNVPGSEQGWIEKEVLGKMLGTDVNHINIQHYRLRKQLLDVLPQPLHLIQLMEARSGQLRIGYMNIIIQGGTLCTTCSIGTDQT